MEWIKTLGITLILLLVVSMISLPTSAIARMDEHKDSMREHGKKYFNKTIPRIRVFENISFEEILNLTYTVRDTVMPLINWSSSYNVTLATVLVRLGDMFLERAINVSETNETRAKVYAMIAAIIYGHAPVTAYPVLAKTIRENLSENHTITDTTVIAVYNRTLELKTILGEAKEIAEEHNISIPEKITALEIIAEGLLNTSRELLDEGYVILAFKYTVKAYHLYVIAYGVLVKSIFIQKLKLDIRPDEPLTRKLILRRIKREVLEKILKRLPKWVRERILERIRSGDVKTWHDLKRVIREEVEKYREKLRNKSIEITADIMTMIIIYIAWNPTVNSTIQDAIWEWLNNHGFVIGFGRHGIIDRRALKEYFRELALNVSLTYNVTGLELVFKVIVEFENILSEELGIDIDLSQIFTLIISCHHVGEERSSQNEHEHGSHGEYGKRQ